MPAFVKLSRLVNAFTKAGAEVEVTHSERQANFGKGVAKLDGRLLEFNFQPGYPDPNTPRVTIIVAASPHTDVMTDCFCDRFFSTIKSAVGYITGN